MTTKTNTAETQEAKPEYLELPLYISFVRERPLDRFYKFIKRLFDIDFLHR